MDTPMLILAVDSLQTARFTSAAATAIYLYNIVTTLDLEVEHIWSRSSLNLPILLYISNRYICLIPFLITMYNLSGFTSGFSDIYCKIPFDAVGVFLSYIGWTGLMALRVCALWRQKLLVVRFVQGAWVCVMITIIMTMGFAYEEIRPTMAYNPAIRLCAPTINPRIFKAAPIAPIFYETVLTTLTIIKGFDFGIYPSRATLPMLYRVVARDGAIYFVVSTAIMVTNMIAWYTLPGVQLYLLSALYWATVSTLMANLILGLRIAHQESVLEQLGPDGIMEAGTGCEIGTYGTSTEWGMAGTMGYRARHFLGEQDIYMVASAVDEATLQRRTKETSLGTSSKRPLPFECAG